MDKKDRGNYIACTVLGMVCKHPEPQTFEAMAGAVERFAVARCGGSVWLAYMDTLGGGYALDGCSTCDALQVARLRSTFHDVALCCCVCGRPTDS